MSANLEIERKFLVENAPAWLSDCASRRVEQGYLALEDDIEVRLRKIAERTLLTVKRGSGGTREEREVAIDATAFDSLWPLTEGRRVMKTRYLCEAEAGTFEIDVYEGDLEGLITAEIEFDSESASEDFDPPDWIGREVTGDAAWANRGLAVDGRPEQ